MAFMRDLYKLYGFLTKNPNGTIFEEWRLSYFGIVMKKITKKVVKGASKEALEITTRAVSGVAADIVKDTLKEELEKSGVTEAVKDKISKTTKRMNER